MIDKPKTKSISKVFDGWFSVEKHIIDVEKVGEYQYDVVDIKGDGVGILAFIDSKTVLLGKQYRLPVDESMVELIQGGMEEHETSLQTAQRELLEETGHTADFTFLGTIYLMPAVLKHRMHIFIAHNLKKVQEAEDDPLEYMETLKIPLEELLEKVLKGDYKDTALNYAVLKFYARQKSK